MRELPEDLRDCEVVAVEVTAPFRVRVTHRDGTSATHIFAPEEFRGSFVELRDPERFAEAEVIDGTLGWRCANGIFDQGPDALWLHAHGVCPAGSHDLAQDAQITLRAPFMSELLPRMRELEAAGWTLRRMDKPITEGRGGEVTAVFARGEPAAT